jgi:hypothetical protein
LLDLGILPCGPLVEDSPKKRKEGPAPECRNEVQRSLSSFSIQNLLATTPVVHTPALASAAGAT